MKDIKKDFLKELNDGKNVFIVREGKEEDSVSYSQYCSRAFAVSAGAALVVDTLAEMTQENRLAYTQAIVETMRDELGVPVYMEEDLDIL